MKSEISRQQGRRLLAFARGVIAQRLGIVLDDGYDEPDDDVLKQQVGTFVTLKIDNRLRGCIGNLEPSGTIVESIRRNAVSSAFNDHRFSPLTADEFKDMYINISILSKPDRLEYLDGDDLVNRLRPGTDGVILSKGRASATFLPQVWEQLPDPGQFLEHLCLKAGLARSAWKQEHPEIFIYHVQYFEEDER